MEWATTAVTIIATGIVSVALAALNGSHERKRQALRDAEESRRADAENQRRAKERDVAACVKVAGLFYAALLSLRKAPDWVWGDGDLLSERWFENTEVPIRQAVDSLAARETREILRSILDALSAPPSEVEDEQSSPGLFRHRLLTLGAEIAMSASRGEDLDEGTEKSLKQFREWRSLHDDSLF